MKKMKKWMISLGVGAAVLLAGAGFAFAWTDSYSQPDHMVPAVTSPSVQRQAATPTTHVAPAQPQATPTTHVAPAQSQVTPTTHAAPAQPQVTPTAQPAPGRPQDKPTTH